VIHKILSTYQSNLPYDDNQEHPDGELWLITEEWPDLPYGIMLEEVATGRAVRYTKDTPHKHLKYGIRGYRE
jgi:hypothetical protein